LKIKHYILVFLSLILFSNNIQSNPKQTNENTLASLGFINQKNDSILIKLYQKSDSLFNKKNYPLSLKAALKVLDDAKEKGDIELVSKTNYLIGKIFYESRSYQKAVSYFKSSLYGSLKILQKNDSLKDQGLNLLNEDYSYLENNFQVGRSYHKLYESGDLNDSVKESIYKDSIFFYYDYVLKSGSIKDDISLLKSRALNNISGIYLQDSLFDKAERYALQSIEIKERLGDQLLIASSYNTLSNIYFYRKEYEESKKALFKGVEALEKIKGEKADEIRAGLFLNIAYSMYMLKDYHAYEYQEDSWLLYEALSEKRNEEKLANIYSERNFDRGLQEGILREEIKREEAEKITWIIGIISFFVIVLLIFILNQYKLRQKNLGLELSKKDLLQQQKLEKVRSESQIRILNATLDGKETERKEIAETLHDSVSALLSSANLHLQACKKQFNGATPIEVDKSQKIINEASQKIRDLSHTLVSSILLKFGLGYAIKDMAEKYSNSQLQIAHETRYIKRYDQGFEIKLYNITQEFINNILKHSNATHASITLIEKNKKLRLVIKDNGDGFDKALIPEKDGLGINQIDARIQMMQGEFTIETSNGKGTHIHIELPVCERVLTKFA
tara:strand:- start:3035 stop:4885 length:1851 start_codon:yes stop_codon:yes gene_type:complete